MTDTNIKHNWFWFFEMVFQIYFENKNAEIKHFGFSYCFCMQRILLRQNRSGKYIGQGLME